MNLDKSSWCGDIYTTLEKLRRDTKSQRNPEHLADLWLISRRARPLGSAASVPSRSVLTAKAASVISPPWLRRPEASITRRHHSVLLNKPGPDVAPGECGCLSPAAGSPDLHQASGVSRYLERMWLMIKHDPVFLGLAVFV